MPSLPRLFCLIFAISKVLFAIHRLISNIAPLPPFDEAMTDPEDVLGEGCDSFDGLDAQQKRDKQFKEKQASLPGPEATPKAIQDRY